MTLTLTFTWKFQNGKHLIFDLYCFESFCIKRLCFYAQNYVFWPLGPFLKIKGPLKGPSKGFFVKFLKVPHNGIIKTLCAKNEVCKSISMTCSTYRRITKDKEENTRKWPKRALKGPKIKISKNKKKIFLMSQGVLYQKIRFLGKKPWPVAGEHTHRHTDTQTHRGFNPWVPYQGFSISSFCLWYERSKKGYILDRSYQRQKLEKLKPW